MIENYTFVCRVGMWIPFILAFMKPLSHAAFRIIVCIGMFAFSFLSPNNGPDYDLALSIRIVSGVFLFFALHSHWSKRQKTLSREEDDDWGSFY